MKRLKVLVVENNPVDEKVLEGMIGRSKHGKFLPEKTSTLKGTLDLLKKKRFDVILLDLNLPDAKGLDTLKKVNKFSPNTAIVVNTGAYQDSVGLKAITQGAQDYLIKGKYDPYTLSKSLYYAVQRKKAELELIEAYNKLKDMQDQLIQAEKMNVVGGIVSGVAHEVKNPLATILYGIEYLKVKCGNKCQEDKITFTLQSITEAAFKANNIVKDLLDFAGISNLKKSPVDIKEIVEDALKLTSHQASKKNISVEKKYSALPKLRLDRNRIEQVVVDVVLNAINAMRENGVLTIKTGLRNFTKLDYKLSGYDKEIKPGDPTFFVAIEDTGSGIAKDHLPKIFDPFFTTRRANGGVGLGLSVARTIMKNHSGAIILNNIKSGGTCARLIFKK